MNSVHRPTAKNFAVTSENKIHSDAIAQRLGFTGALVPGVTVFGHLTWPLTARLGAEWLTNSTVSTRFLKPAYDGEQLGITERRGAAGSEIECRNSAETLLATLTYSSDALPPISSLASLRGTVSRKREAIAWDNVIVGQPFETYGWVPDEAHNLDYAQRLDDTTALFKQGVVHPHAILSQANQALVRHFIMPAWIHTGSVVQFRHLIAVNDSIEVRAVPIDKWEKKGHQFIKLYIAFVRHDQVVTEIEHTAIFKIAGA